MDTKKRPSAIPKGQRGKEAKTLEVVLKSDSSGSEEAVMSAIEGLRIPDISLKVIHSGVGDITKSDLLIALTGGRLIAGFNVGIGKKIEPLCKEQGIEVRFYHVIYRLIEDLRRIAESLALPDQEEEKILGKGKVIAIFKGGRKGIILGVEISDGTLVVGKRFRIISAMGPIYVGKVESLQIEKHAVTVAESGRQVGLKIENFDKQAKIGDLIECFETLRPKKGGSWHPKGGAFEIE